MLMTRDSWAKQRGVSKVEAKQNYVSALLKVGFESSPAKLMLDSSTI